jgi:hypothetical protein
MKTTSERHLDQHAADLATVDVYPIRKSQLPILAARTSFDREEQH